MCESPHVIIAFFRFVFVSVSLPLSKKISLPMAAYLFPNNKLLPFRELFASYLVLSTIGVYHQHQTCGVPTRLQEGQKRGHDNHYNEHSKTIIAN